jgi:ComF family protein
MASLARGALGCWRCGEAMELEIDLEDLRFSGQMAAKMRCRACRMAEPEFDRAVAFGDYDGELRKLIHLMKFDGVVSAAGLLGARLAEAVLQLEGVAGKELLVVAVPLFGARKRERGYNQSVLLADRALARLGKLRPDWRLTAAHGLMRRVRRTEAQYTLSQRERRRNLRGAFAVVGNVSGREVLLIDDIMTSGATARECARVLKAAGAAKVWVATVARAQRREMVRIEEEPDDAVAVWDAA